MQQDAELTELTARVAGGIARNRRQVKTVRRIASFCTTATIVFVCLRANTIANYLWGLLLVGLVNLFLKGAVINIGSGLWARRSRPDERAAARRLAALDDVRSVGSLIDTLQWTNDKGIHKTALRPERWQGLIQQLPCLTEEQARQLSRERHLQLAYWMKHWDFPGGVVALGSPLALGLLHVMACVGRDAIESGKRGSEPIRLLPILGTWISGKEAGQDPAVQKAAAECRETILQKLARTQPGAELLRASAPHPDNLLRPAQGPSQTDPQELLRPGTSGVVPAEPEEKPGPCRDGRKE